MLSYIKEFMFYYFNVYFELFVGVGVVLFEFVFNIVYINDVNKDLIFVYIIL